MPCAGPPRAVARSHLLTRCGGPSGKMLRVDYGANDVLIAFSTSLQQIKLHACLIQGCKSCFVHPRMLCGAQGQIARSDCLPTKGCFLSQVLRVTSTRAHTGEGPFPPLSSGPQHSRPKEPSERCGRFCRDRPEGSTQAVRGTLDWQGSGLIYPEPPEHEDSHIIRRPLNGPLTLTK